MELEGLLKIAVDAALGAGSEIMSVYNTTEFGVEHKNDNSPITLADKRANNVINKILLKTGIPIISEENKEVAFNERATWDRCWIVDPLDGTKEFINRNGEFTVNIALIDGSEPVLGVIFVPVSNLLYASIVPQKKLWKQKLTQQEHLITEQEPFLRPKKTTNQKVVVLKSRSHLNTETEILINELKASKPNIELVSIGSSLKFCLIAEGKADLYPRLAPTMEWDTAAGHALCRAVGIELVGTLTNEPLRYNKKELINPSFIVI